MELRESTLELKDGPSFNGIPFGASRSAVGEVVFNTGMVGYCEALTDPSYRGQILVLTFPLIGNYGVPCQDILDELGLPKYFESNSIHVAALVIASYSQHPSHWASIQSLGDWLKSQNIPGIYGVDTRAITKIIRESGTSLGRLKFQNESPQYFDPNLCNLVQQVSTTKICHYGKGQSPSILMLDCGIKFNIIRYFVTRLGVHCIRVPYDYNIELNSENLQYDGIFISNGPGDPNMLKDTITSIAWAIQRPKNEMKPIFGICMGNLILALASGACTYKMKFGNRGLNQPCIDLRSGRCYITPQNHGYAVDSDSLKPHWRAFFINANDFSNEGLIHTTKPIFSVQFHPEASAGPTDTSFLFDMFVDNMRGKPILQNLIDPSVYLPSQSPVRKVLILGSGGLTIGQAGEFDYSGSQAIKALKEEGIEVVLINPNIATVQTSSNIGVCADSVYLLPLTRASALSVIEKDKPDSILVGMGGQTALNVGIELFENGDLAKHGVRVLGTQIPVIVATEDRELFSLKLAEISESLALSRAVTTVQQALDAASFIGYPVLVRAAFSLGGLGSGFADSASQLEILAEKALSLSSQILIDQDLRGWKEIEYEVVRDSRDNCVTVCNMENFDPLGVHTGDSIVVAPSQSLSNREYFLLRETSIKVVRHLGIVGECNIQFGLNPQTEQYCIIEVNARLSRSSALASKATGYPLAYVATKLCLGKDLVNLRNTVTKVTSACFEPAMDYCVVKMPRWDLAKFSRVSRRLGSAMCSVGEVMAIGRSFEETIQKAARMVSGGPGLEGSFNGSLDELSHELKNPTDLRLFQIQYALEIGWTLDRIHQLTKIDMWFLHKLKNIQMLAAHTRSVLSANGLCGLDLPLCTSLKQSGFSDLQIAKYANSHNQPQEATTKVAEVTESHVRTLRLKLGVKPLVKQIDTMAAEFPAHTNYLYLTYHGCEHDIIPDSNSIIVLGCGAYCIGSSVEFDWSAVSCVRTLKTAENAAVVINYNPETVSTDYDESDRLYFEELSLERVLDIYQHERAASVIVSVGGQIAQNLSMPLYDCGVNILGTSALNIDRAEDRHKFSKMLDSIHVDQPLWRELATLEDAVSFADECHYPVVVRPSFVLSGAAMNIANNHKQLLNYLNQASNVSGDKPVVISKFIANAKEIEFDAVALDGNILNFAISEHLENAGCHSGDATLVLPAQKLYQESIRRIKKIGQSIAHALNITGPFNCQLIAKDNEIKVIECNLRASRTFPFVSKTLNANFIALATKAMLGLPVKPYRIALNDIDYVAVKCAMFSFTRLHGAEPTCGIEMTSTGEVACFGDNVHEAFRAAIQATGFKLPKANGSILISIGKSDEDQFLDRRYEFRESVMMLIKMGFRLYGTPGTAEYYNQLGIEVIPVLKYPEADNEVLKKSIHQGCNTKCPHQASHYGVRNVVDLIKSGIVDLVINVPDGYYKENVSKGYMMRRTTVDFGIPLITNVKVAKMYVDSEAKFRSQNKLMHHNKCQVPKTVQEFYNTGVYV